MACATVNRLRSPHRGVMPAWRFLASDSASSASLSANPDRRTTTTATSAPQSMDTRCRAPRRSDAMNHPVVDADRGRVAVSPETTAGFADHRLARPRRDSDVPAAAGRRHGARRAIASSFAERCGTIPTPAASGRMTCACNARANTRPWSRSSPSQSGAVSSR